jgi:TolA-binding protein
MKAQERHHLKQNEFAQTAARVAGAVAANRDRVAIGLLVAVVLSAVVGGYFYWQKRTNDRASAEFGIGLAIARAPVTPAGTLPTATQAPGTYATEKERHEAALQQFQKTATDFTSTDSGIAARYHTALELIALGRVAEAETAFQDVIARGGDAIYVPAAKMGLADILSAQGKHDDAIRRLNDLAADRDGLLPIDGVLMQLARASAKAGKPQDAKAAYKRVVDEFPDSFYANEARQQLTLLN